MESFDVDIDMDEFFEAGEKGHPIDSESSEPLVTIDARHAQKMTAAARARRAHLSRYVLGVVSVAASVLLLGVTARLRHSPEPSAPRAVTTTAPAEIAQAPQAPIDVSAGEVSPEPQERAVEVVAAVKTSHKPNVARVDEEVAPSLTTDDDPKPMAPVRIAMSAGQAKEAAKAALDHGANGAAISAGERSVVLDGSDAEAWLVLGAAYQATGNVGHAKSCYDACVSHGSKGPVDECRDMLRTL